MFCDIIVEPEEMSASREWLCIHVSTAAGPHSNNSYRQYSLLGPCGEFIWKIMCGSQLVLRQANFTQHYLVLVGVVSGGQMQLAVNGQELQP